MLLTGPRAGRWTRAAEIAHLRARDWAGPWRAAAVGCGLHRLTHVAAGITESVPALASVRELDDGTIALRVRPLPGQLPEDFTAAATRLAAALGAARVRVTPDVGGRIVQLDLLRVDPLARTIRWRPGFPGLLGVDEGNRGVSVRWVHRGHTITQGQTGAGKSTFTYGSLASLAADPDTLIAGLDPSGLLWRPFAGTRHEPWQVSGLSGDLAEHLELLDRLVGMMDSRIAAIPPDRDSVRVGAGGWPLVLVVLEEYAGLLRAADVAGRETGKRIRAAVARLLAEGRKAGIRALILVQRADASVVDGLVRAQCATRISFSVDSGDAVRMLHPAAADVADVLAAPPGIALVTRPGQPMLRLRVPLLDYATYARHVREHA